jgi:GNAT superfamily N-acetyltransferase
MTMSIKIRRATNADIPALDSLISISVRSLSRNYYSERQIEGALINIFGVDTQLIDDGTYYIAETEDQICGCGGWSKRKTLFGGDQTKTGMDELLDPRIEPARIRAFFVHPGWARQGIGRRILQICEEAALEAGFKELELAATLPGEPFYRTLGYEAVESFEVAMPGEVVLQVIRMKKEGLRNRRK